MPGRTVEISLSPEVLKWARETAGVSLEAVAQRFKVSTEQVTVWENPPPARISLSRLEKLAHYYKRPIAAFLLRERPPSPPVPRDFRRPAQREAPFSPELRLAIRRAYRFQRLVRETLEATNQPFESRLSRASVDEEAEEVAQQQRASFGVSASQQLKLGGPPQAFRQWRNAIESRTVPVFQGDFLREEAQGFSLTTSLPYAITLSSRDAIAAKSFTLFHEFAHLLLRRGGICQTEEAVPPNGVDVARIEEWCDRFAEAFLIDASTVRSRVETDLVIRHDPGYEQALRRLANAFGVSQHVVLFRLWHLGLLDDQQFWRDYQRVADEAVAAIAAREKKKKKKKKGGPPPAEKAIQERGPLFARVVLDALEREVLTGVEAIDYLGVRLKHLDRVREVAQR